MVMDEIIGDIISSKEVVDKLKFIQNGVLDNL